MKAHKNVELPPSEAEKELDRLQFINTIKAMPTDEELLQSYKNCKGIRNKWYRWIKEKKRGYALPDLLSVKQKIANGKPGEMIEVTSKELNALRRNWEILMYDKKPEREYYFYVPYKWYF